MSIVYVPGGLGEVTVEKDAKLVCKGNNTSNTVHLSDFVSKDGGPIAGVAEEQIMSW